MKRSPMPRRKRPLASSRLPLRRTKLAAVSPKQKPLKEQWHRLRDTMLVEEPRCQYVTKLGHRCEKAAQDVHHIRGRGPFLLVREHLMCICRYHHDKIHQHPNEARRNGWLK